MKRGREEEVEETYGTESGHSRPSRQGSPPKRKRWYVVKYVQRLLTNYFISPKGPAAPRREEEDQHQGSGDEELPDAESRDECDHDNTGATMNGGPVMLSCH